MLAIAEVRMVEFGSEAQGRMPATDRKTAKNKPAKVSYFPPDWIQLQLDTDE
jgi:hypothetical protein